MEKERLWLRWCKWRDGKTQAPVGLYLPPLYSCAERGWSLPARLGWLKKKYVEDGWQRSRGGRAVIRPRPSSVQASKSVRRASGPVSVRAEDQCVWSGGTEGGSFRPSATALVRRLQSTRVQTRLDLPNTHLLDLPCRPFQIYEHRNCSTSRAK